MTKAIRVAEPFAGRFSMILLLLSWFLILSFSLNVFPQAEHKVRSETRAAGLSVDSAELVNVRTFVKAFNGRDIEAMLELCDEGIQWLSIDGTSVRIEAEGREALRKSIAEQFQSCASCRSELVWAETAGSRVAALERASWIGNGRQRSGTSLSVYEFRGGKILRVFYFPAESESDIGSKIDGFLARVSEQGFSGSVLVAKDGELFEKCYGFADIEKKIKCGPGTVYDIGSVTKQFTAAAVLKLEVQGKLSVSDKLEKYFPDIPDDKGAITVHQLLTHSAGLPEAIGRDYEVLSRNDFLTKAFASELLFKPGEKFAYSNVGYSILAAVIETASGQSFEQFLRENLFLPAKMFDTGYSMPAWKDEQIAVGYSNGLRWGKPTEKPWDKTAPYWNLLGNGGILSSTADLYKWHEALRGETILDKEARDRLYKRHVRQDLLVGAGDEGFYGYGWALVPTQENSTLITHSGGNGIFFADFWRLLEEDETIILLSNSSQPEFETIPSQIHKLLSKGKQGLRKNGSVSEPVK